MRQAKIIRPRGVGYRVKFRDPMPGDTVVVKLDKPDKDGNEYLELELADKTSRDLFRAVTVRGAN